QKTKKTQREINNQLSFQLPSDLLFLSKNCKQNDLYSQPAASLKHHAYFRAQKNPLSGGFLNLINGRHTKPIVW
ncbi:TPA: hypothetical protein ACHOQR_002920, partial [Escherichia coli]